VPPLAEQFAIVTVDTPTGGTTTVDITSGSISQDVKSAIFIYGHSTTNSTMMDHGCLGIGMWADDQETNSPGTEYFGSMYTRGLDGVTSTTDTRSLKSLLSIHTIESDSTPVVDMRITGIAVISGGLRLTLSTNTIAVSITAIMFAGQARSWVSQIGSGVSSAHENTGGAGNTFQPDMLIVFGGESGFGASLQNDFYPQLGFVVGSTHAGAAIRIDRGSDPTDAYGQVDGTEIPFIDPTSFIYTGVTFTIDSSGYNHQLTTPSTGSLSPDTLVMAIKFASSLSLFTDNLALSGSSPQSFSCGFQPMLVLGMATRMLAEGSFSNDTTCGSAGYFAFDDSTARAYSGCHKVNATIAAPPNDSVSQSAQGDFAVLCLDHDGAGYVASSSWAMDSDGFTLTFSDTGTGFLTFLAIGGADQTIVCNETMVVTDTDGGNAILNLYLVVNDTETVAESCVSFTNNVMSPGPPIGYTYTAGSKRGTCLVAGAVAGHTL
jgi:hypothetical protein